MQLGNTKTETIVEVRFSEKEWAMLKARADAVSNPPAEYIHDVVIRSLKRKKRVKEDIQT